MANAFCSVTGVLLVVAGFIFGGYWQLRYLATIYKFSAGWFFAVLVVPLADWAFALLYFKFARKPFGFSLIGSIMILIGVYLAGIYGHS